MCLLGQSRDLEQYEIERESHEFHTGDEEEKCSREGTGIGVRNLKARRLQALEIEKEKREQQEREEKEKREEKFRRRRKGKELRKQSTHHYFVKTFLDRTQQIDSDLNLLEW